MAIPNTFTNGTLANADEVNSNFSYVNGFKSIKKYDSNIQMGLMKFTDDIWCSTNRRTADGGDTWSAVGGTIADNSYVFDSETSNGVSIKYDGTVCNISSDAGANWSSATDTPGLSKINAVSILGDKAIAVGDDGTNNSVYYSSDGGDNWSECTTSLTGEFGAVDLASSTIAYAVLNSDGSIYKSTDSGDNWTATGEFFVAATKSILATSTTVVYGVPRTYPALYKYTDGVGRETLFSLDTGAIGRTTNIVETDNGDICFAFMFSSGAGSSNYSTIWIFVYDGSNISYKQIGFPFTQAVFDGVFDVNGSDATIPSLIASGDILYLNINDNIIEVKLQ